MTDFDPTTVTDRDVFITRSFAAPREIVWKFWTEPERLSQWFGPTGWSAPVDLISVDAREGGDWNITMEDDATGDRAPIRATFVTVREPEYLEIVMSADTGVGELENVLLRVQFHDHGETTRMTLHQGPFTADQRAQTDGGWTLSFDKLDALIA